VAPGSPRLRRQSNVVIAARQKNMNDPDRYAPPESEVADLEEAQGLKAGSWVLLAAVALQLMGAMLFAPTFLFMVNTGIYSGLHLLLTWLAAVLMLAGAVLLLRQSGSATGCFIGAAIFGALSLFQSGPLLSITGAVLAVVAPFVSVRQFRQRPPMARREGYP
jgi:hypothetical protein